LAGLTPLPAAFELDAWGDTAAQQEGFLPGAAPTSPVAAWRDAGQGSLAQPFAVEAAPIGRSQWSEPAWLSLAGAGRQAPPEAVDYLFVSLGS
jgi:hypothetical protein